MRKAILAAVAMLLVSSPCFAQFFAYVPLGALDAGGHPVIDPKTGKQIDDGICLIWRANWVLDNPDIDVFDSKGFYTSISYRADPRAHTVTVYKAESPAVVAITSGTGWYPIGRTVVFKLNVTVPMYPEPQAQWPCSKENWELVLSLPERETSAPHFVLPRSGGQVAPTPNRPPFAVCKNPNWPGFRC
jgi:hypothetical protein